MRVRIGTSGWSYPSWRPGFYPAGLPPSAFLGFYAGCFDTVELNTTGYRLPAPEQFQRWAASVPDGFCFAPKLALRRLEQLAPFFEGVERLGDRCGPLRVVVQGVRDERLLESVIGATPSGFELAFDFRHASWDGVGGVVAVNDLAAEPFRYIRLREPPYSDAELGHVAVSLRPPAYVYVRHEHEPTAPVYARRLQSLLNA